MERVIIFNLLLLLASGYAVWRGGVPERIVGISLLLAGLLTRLAYQPFAERFVSVDWGVLAIDVALLTVLIAVALYADRFWPLWLAAFHVLGTGAHLVRGMDHGIEPVAYAILLAAWSYPMIVLLVLGTARHARRRRVGPVRDWSGSPPLSS
ncbi:hypothetical protein HJG53_10785 [Sphingomonas sp. ID1715]|uniref:hypothetical protein n=1 Tax=Sphingomonas sp. ID1715 TaxID=1656898 RepID=UPI001488C469|nr:hypothetical protein [Sphingomonas sp. ID1715]NNM77390.1 hypothetical protein [Sphingomonas sp. ID1715]